MMMGHALSPIMMGLALTPCLFLGLALHPICKIWFLIVLQLKKIKITEGISFARLSTMTLMVSSATAAVLVTTVS
jgi:hypothetical protein